MNIIKIDNCYFAYRKINGGLNSIYFYRLLKGRFKRLRPLVQCTVDDANKTILAACTLHNICIISADDFQDDLDMVEGLPNEFEQRNDMEIANTMFSEQDRARGSLKRLNIARTVHQFGRRG